MSFLKKGSRFEKYVYESKPVLYFLGSLALLNTQWGFLSLALALATLFYMGGLVYLRHNHRGSFKNWLSA